MGPAAVTLVEGSPFCISGPTGDMEGARPHGLLFRDTRVLCHLDLFVDRASIEPLASMTPRPFQGTLVGQRTLVSRSAEGALIVQRQRRVGIGVREDLRLRSFGTEASAHEIELLVNAGFADLFEVKEGRAEKHGPSDAELVGEGLILHQSGSLGHGVAVNAADAISTDRGLHFLLPVPPGWLLLGYRSGRAHH